MYVFVYTFIYDKSQHAFIVYGLAYMLEHVFVTATIYIDIMELPKCDLEEGIRDSPVNTLRPK